MACPHCGVPTPHGRRRKRWTLVVTVGAAAVLAGGLGFAAASWADRTADAAAPRTAAGAPDARADGDRRLARDGASAPGAADGEAGADAPPGSDEPAPATGPSPVVALRAEGRRGEVFALAVRAAGGSPLWMLPAEDLPLRGDLRLAHRPDDPLELLVVHDAVSGGFVLLQAPEPDDAVAFAPPAARGDPLAAGRRGEAVPAAGRRAPRAAAATLVLEPGFVDGGRRRVRSADGSPVPPGLAMRDAEGRLLGLTVEPPGTLLPVTLADGWWRSAGSQPAGVPFAEAQQRRRAADPLALVEDAVARLEAAPGDIASLRQVLELTARARALAFDQEVLAVVDEVDARAAARLARALVRADRGGEALAEVERAVARLASAPAGLLVDLVTLLARYDTPERALARWRQGLAARIASSGSAEDDVDAARRALVDAVLALWKAEPARGAPLVEEALVAFPEDDRLLAARSRIAAAAEREARAFERDRGRRPRRLEVPLGEQGVASTDVVLGPASRRARGYERRYIVDTGAALTTVPPDVAEALGLTTLRPVTLVTASGCVESRVVLLPRLRIGGIVLRDVEAAVLALPTEGRQGEAAGLLGLDALKRLDFSIDRQRGVLVLEQR